MSESGKVVRVHGVDVPALGLGTWRLDGQECFRVVLSALEIGYRHIDTAQTYYNEEQVGRAIHESGIRRDAIFLTTKLTSDDVTHAAVLRSTEQSLRKLKTDYVDLLLIHWPSRRTPLTETLQAMEELVSQSMVRHIGVSNFPSALLKEACRLSNLPIFANQVEYHPYLSQQKLLDTCRREGVLLTAYAPIARGKVLQEELLKNIGMRYGKSPVQVTLRWLIQQRLVSAIPKSAHADRLASNFDVFDFELTDREMSSIFGLARGERMLNPGVVPEWDD